MDKLTVEEQLKNEVDRLTFELLRVKRRVNGLEKKIKNQKFVISKQSKQLKKLSAKERYKNQPKRGR